MRVAALISPTTFCLIGGSKPHPLPLEKAYLGNEVVDNEDVCRTGQYGEGRGVVQIGSEEAVGREPRNSHIAEVGLEVDEGYRHLKGMEDSDMITGHSL